MQKVVIEQAGGYERLQLKTLQDPVPGKGEVLIETRAIGVNFADCCVRMGVYSSAKKYVGWPITPGFEVSGVVIAVGTGVTRYKVGDRVIALVRFGAYATHLTVAADQIFPLPDDFSFVVGAAVPVVCLTAYYALFELAHPRKGSRVLVHSAAGGVGSSLVQMAKLVGCEVTGVVGSSAKVAHVKNLGADQVIDKSSQDLWTVAGQIAPKGFDVILDANGIETLQQSYDHLAPGGKLIVYGFHTMFSKGRGTPNWIKMAWDYFRTPKFDPMKMTNDNRSVMAFNLSYLFDQKDLLMQSAEQIFKWYEAKQLMAPLVKKYPLQNVAAAHRDLESGNTMGKLVLIARED